jgi:hypothetical protein
VFEAIHDFQTSGFPWCRVFAVAEPWRSGKAWQVKVPLTRVLVRRHPHVATRACHYQILNSWR